ncbi:MAG: hypothetical protein ACHP93_05625 [Solirubrobacterales bacterium]|nr:hypothetical protein [Thermoplasmata archaeon]
MPRTAPTSLHGRHQALLLALEQAEAEASRLAVEEERLAAQLKQAREQVRYYEGLLATLRQEWGKPPPLSDLRKLG